MITKAVLIFFRIELMILMGSIFYAAITLESMQVLKFLVYPVLLGVLLFTRKKWSRISILIICSIALMRSFLPGGNDSTVPIEHISIYLFNIENQSSVLIWVMRILPFFTFGVLGGMMFTEGGKKHFSS